MGVGRGHWTAQDHLNHSERRRREESVARDNVHNREVKALKEKIKNLENILEANPIPENFKILRQMGEGRLYLVEAEYPNCTNNEGKKFILLRLAGISGPGELESLDPHFSGDENSEYTVLCRFMPNMLGWDMGMDLLQRLQSMDDDLVANLAKM